MNKPICIECQREMKLNKMGVSAVMLYQNPPEPYKSYRADLFECPECGRQVIANFADNPEWEQWHDKPAPEGEHVYYIKER